MKEVRRCAAEAGVPLPLAPTKDSPLIIKTIAYFKNGIHCDPENVRKAVSDALVYDPEKKRGDDKYTGGIFPPPKYDKENPRTVIIIKSYRQ